MNAIVILLALINPVPVILVLIRIIKSIKGSLAVTSGNNSINDFVLIEMITLVLAPFSGFLMNNSKGEESVFEVLAAPYHISIMILFVLCSFIIWLKRQLPVNHTVYHVALLSVILLSILAFVQFGEGLMFSLFPIAGLTILAPLVNVFLLLRLFIISIRAFAFDESKGSVNREKIRTGTVGSIAAMMVFLVVFQLILWGLGFDQLSLVKAFTHSVHGFFSCR